MPELKPCPFCGEVVFVRFNKSVPYETDDYFYMVCNDCSAEIRFADYDHDKDKAIAAWNNRQGKTE